MFAFRRKGLKHFCTCTKERYAELSAKPNLFETRIFYTTPPTHTAGNVLEDAGGANWQDISTAPKDGTRFVAVGNNYGLDSETQHTCIAQWFRGCWMEVSDWNEASELKYLTHWMPLPPLPGSAASATANSVTAPAATCPTCEAPCTTTVNMRGGEHGWGTTDLERTVYHYAPAQAADSVLEDTARLDWLEGQSQVNIERVRYLGADTSIYEVTPFNSTDYNGETLREAIDAARKQGANHD